MQQGQRNRALQRLRDGHTRVLVATDVAARGIDVAGISHVINFDLPRQAEDYVHRIGRTGRAGRTGIAVSLVGMREGGLVKNIERYTSTRIDVHTIAGLEPTQKPQSGGRPAGGNGRPRSGAGGGNRGFGEKRSWGGNEGRSERPQNAAPRASYGDAPRAYGDRPPRGDSQDNRDRGFRDTRPARPDAPRGAPSARFGADTRPARDAAPRVYGDRQPRVDPRAASQDFGPRRYWDETKPEVDGNSVEYWAKRESEAKARSARPAGGNHRPAGAAAPRRPAGDTRVGAPRSGVRGRFKD
jgi:superfamily II DNA/RNA helicase